MDIQKLKKEGYNKKYYLQHKDDWYEKTQCDICNGFYCRASKSRHLKSKKHICAEKDKQIQEQLQELTQKINNIKDTLNIVA